MPIKRNLYSAIAWKFHSWCKFQKIWSIYKKAPPKVRFDVNHFRCSSRMNFGRRLVSM